MTLFHSFMSLAGIVCPYCRNLSDTLRGVDACKEDEEKLIDNALNHYKIRVSRHDDGVKKAILCLIKDGFTMGSTSSDELRAMDQVLTPATPPLRLELARLEYARERQQDKKRKRSSEQNDHLPLGPLLKLTIARNYILERAIEFQESSTPPVESAAETIVSLTTKRPTPTKRKPQVIESEVMEKSDEEEEEELEVEKVETQSVAQEHHKADHDAAKAITSLRDIKKNDLEVLAAYHQAETYVEVEQQSPKMSFEQPTINMPMIKIGAPVIIVSGALLGTKGICMGYTNSGDGMRVEYSDRYGITRRAAVLRKNVREECDSRLAAKESSSSSSNSSVYCLCGKPQHGVYVKCKLGISECHGWVHPQCCYDLSNLTIEQLQVIDATGYTCIRCKFISGDHSKHFKPNIYQKDMNREMIGDFVILGNFQCEGKEAIILDVSEAGVAYVSLLLDNSGASRGHSIVPKLLGPYIVINTNGGDYYPQPSAASMMMTHAQAHLPPPSNPRIEKYMAHVMNLSNPYMMTMANPYASAAAAAAEMSHHRPMMSMGDQTSSYTTTNPSSKSQSSALAKIKSHGSGEVNLDAQLKEWSALINMHIPCLAGHPNGRPVTLGKVKEFWDRILSLGAYSYSVHYPHELVTRLTSFIRCIEHLDATVKEDLSKVRNVLELQDGKMDNDIKRRNLMEKKLGQLLNVTFENHTKIGVRCPSLQIILRVLSWCNMLCLKLLTMQSPGKAFREEAMRQAREYLISAKAMQTIETYETLWVSDSAGASRSDASLMKRPQMTEYLVDVNHPNYGIIIILVYILEYWMKYISSLDGRSRAVGSDVRSTNSVMDDADDSSAKASELQDLQSKSLAPIDEDDDDPNVSIFQHAVPSVMIKPNASSSSSNQQTESSRSSSSLVDMLAPTASSTANSAHNAYARNMPMIYPSFDSGNDVGYPTAASAYSGMVHARQQASMYNPSSTTLSSSSSLSVVTTNPTIAAEFNDIRQHLIQAQTQQRLQQRANDLQQIRANYQLQQQIYQQQQQQQSYHHNNSSKRPTEMTGTSAYSDGRAFASASVASQRKPMLNNSNSMNSNAMPPGMLFPMNMAMAPMNMPSDTGASMAGYHSMPQNMRKFTLFALSPSLHRSHWMMIS
jgi:hypothetical protein